jgi:hypothetical protein
VIPGRGAGNKAAVFRVYLFRSAVRRGILNPGICDAQVGCVVRTISVERLGPCPRHLGRLHSSFEFIGVSYAWDAAAMNESERKSSRTNTGQTEDISPKLREIFRKKRRLALAKQRQGSRCSLLVLFRVMLHIYRRMHRRMMQMFVRAFVRVNFARVLHRRADVVEPLD